MILFNMLFHDHLCVLCSYIDTGFKEVQTVINLIKPFVHFLTQADLILFQPSLSLL